MKNESYHFFIGFFARKGKIFPPLDKRIKIL